MYTSAHTIQGGTERFLAEQMKESKKDSKICVWSLVQILSGSGWKLFSTPIIYTHESLQKYCLLFYVGS